MSNVETNTPEGHRGPQLVKPPAPTTLAEVKKEEGFEQWWVLRVVTSSGLVEELASPNFQLLRDAAFDSVRRTKVFVILDGFAFTTPNFGRPARPDDARIVMKKSLAIRSDEVAMISVSEIANVFHAVTVADLESVAARGF